MFKVILDNKEVGIRKSVVDARALLKSLSNFRICKFSTCSWGSDLIEGVESLGNQRAWRIEKC